MSTQIEYHASSSYLKDRNIFAPGEKYVFGAGLQQVHEALFIAPDPAQLRASGPELFGNLNHPLKTAQTGNVALQLFNAAIDRLKPARDDVKTTEFLTLEGSMYVHDRGVSDAPVTVLRGPRRARCAPDRVFAPQHGHTRLVHHPGRPIRQARRPNERRLPPAQRPRSRLRAGSCRRTSLPAVQLQERFVRADRSAR